MAVYHRGDGSTEITVRDPSASEGDGGATGGDDARKRTTFPVDGRIRGNGRTNDCRSRFTPEGCNFPIFSSELSVPSLLVSGQIYLLFFVHPVSQSATLLPLVSLLFSFLTLSLALHFLFTPLQLLNISLLPQ